jgi:hypothetical protein
VPQSSRIIKSSTRISYTHNGSKKACVMKEMALKGQVCCWNGQELSLAWDGRVFIAHTPKTSRSEDSTHFTIKPQCNSWSDHQGGNGYKFAKIDRWRSWRSDRPCWRSDCPEIEASGLTSPYWRLDRQGVTRTLQDNLQQMNIHPVFFSNFSSHSKTLSFQGYQELSVKQEKVTTLSIYEESEYS